MGARFVDWTVRFYRVTFFVSVGLLCFEESWLSMVLMVRFLSPAFPREVPCIEHAAGARPRKTGGSGLGFCPRF